MRGKQIPVRLRAAVAVIGLALALSAVATAEVKVFPTRGEDVTRYATYQWVPPRVVGKQGIVENDTEISPLIKESVNRHLALRGYREVAEGGELLVLTAGVSASNTQLEGFLLTWGFDVFWGYYGVTTVSPISRVNRQGVLLINLVDAATQKGVWAGYATEALGRPGTVGKSIEKAASKILGKLPKRKS